ncbi:hypothetical protein Tco_1131093, partial [Tanacetum coccineum]
EEAAREALAIDICKRFSILEEERLVIETMAYSDKYKKILDGIVMDKIKLDGEIKKEEEEAIKQAKGESLKEKEEPGAFVILIRLETKIDLNALVDTGSDINSIGTHNDEAGSSLSHPKRARITEDIEEALMGRVLHEFLLWGNCNLTLKNRYNTNLAGNLSKQIYSPFIVDWNVLNTLGCGNAIEDMLEGRVNEMGRIEVLFTSEAWKRAFDINEPIYTKLCHEFYATFKFDEAVADDELMMKKAIKFRLCGKAYSMSIPDFAKRLGLYTSAKIQDYGFETYFIGGLRNDDDFSVNRIAKKLIILSKEVLNGLSAPTYCRTLDANILRELIGSNGRLIPEEIAPSIPRVSTPRAPRPTTSDLYDKISNWRLK